MPLTSPEIRATSSLPTTLALTATLAFVLSGCQATPPSPAPSPRYVLVIHGGAGTLPRADATPERETALRQTLTAALQAGERILQTNGTSLDAVSAAIRVLEDSPLFNAGRGAVLNRDGIAEMDAAIMDGATRRAGAVAGVRQPRHPIDAARAVMERSPHVLLVGPGADAFAQQQGLPLEPPEFFITEPRRQQWQRLQREHASPPQLNPSSAIPAPPRSATSSPAHLDPIGTVGAVALDRSGNLAAGTSTGGLAFKLPGRVGDSPLIGAGTYADNATCAVSATGHGEFFIRAAVAHDIAARMAYRGHSLAQAAHDVIQKTVPALGGSGGIIALDRLGNIAMPFTTEGMYRGSVREGHLGQVWVFEGP